MEDPVPLSLEVISKGLTRLERTVDGSGYAFIRLDCSERGLTDITDEIDELKHLRQVILKSNHIGDASKLSVLPHLLSLDLSHNKLTAMDGLFQPECLQWCQYIDISHNSIISICPIAAMPRLRVLKLNANNVEDASRISADGHPALEELDLSENSLKTLDGLNNMPKLKFLKASSNQLTHIGEKALLGLDDLELLDLHDANTLLTITGKPIEKAEHEGEVEEEQPQEEQEEIPPPSPRSLPKFPSLPSLKTLNLSSTQFGADRATQILAEIFTTTDGHRALPKLTDIDLSDTPALTAIGDDVKAELILVLPKTLRIVNGEVLTLDDLKASEDLHLARVAEQEEKERLEAEARAAAEAADGDQEE